MWELREPNPVKLIIGILAADKNSLSAAAEAIEAGFGQIDLHSEIWSFTQTDYYEDQSGLNIVRQFVSFEKLIDPGELADIKHKTNQLEEELAEKLKTGFPRPVNLDPGFIEPSKLILASTKNFSHRIYIGKKMYAEVTLCFDKGTWRSLPYTFPDYRQSIYHDFFEKVRKRLLEQLKSQH
jgi:hypothetical protein